MKFKQADELHPQEMVELLGRPNRRSGRSRRIDVIETHFAWVFLTGALAYKIKKPVRYRSMDCRTLVRRERACRNELRLNRRLAQSTYLDVIPVVRKKDGSLGLGRGRQVIDWAIKMRRLPAARMLDRAIAEHAVTPRDLGAVVRLLSNFFKHARHAAISPRAYGARLHSLTTQNSRDLHEPDLGLSTRRVEAVIRPQLDFIVKGAPLLGPRAARLIDGHGDLRPEHVFLGSASDQPCVIDCLEFDRDLRRLDPAEELAFLGLECTRLGGSRFGSDVARLVQLTMDDPVPDALMDFYKSQRAVIRAKIAAWHQLDPQLAGNSRHWRAAGNSYLADALRYIRLALRDLTKR